MDDSPVPSPEVVHAARAHLTRLYAKGVEGLLWREHEQPLPDVAAIVKTIVSIREAEATGKPAPGARDLAAALVVLRAAHQDMIRLEVDLIDAVREAGLDWTAIAALLDMADAQAVQRRYDELRALAASPIDRIAPPGLPHPTATTSAQPGTGSAADRADDAADVDGR